METRWIKDIDKTLDEKALKEAGDIIKNGGLVAFPTETVYGLGGDALNPESSRKIYAAKGRPSDNPLIVHICRMEDLSKIVCEIPEDGMKLAKAFWPGPLTMIFKKSDLVPKETTGGLDTVAVRFPDHEVARRFIDMSGGFVAAPSANISGRPSPTLGQYVYEDMNGRIEMILDGGQVGIGVESTIVDLTGQQAEILRPGYITKAMLETVLEHVGADPTMFCVDAHTQPKAPGMKYKHYAPKGQLTIVSGDSEKVKEYIVCKLSEMKKQGYKTGVISYEDNKDAFLADSVKVTGERGDLSAAAHQLFRFLREFDDEGIEYMYAEAFSEEGIGQAVMNRMLKAAGHNVVYV